MRELIAFMNEREVSDNKIGLKKLKHTVNYFLESSQENVLIEDHIVESANKLLEELREAQKKKVNLVVWFLLFFFYCPIFYSSSLN